MVSLSHICDRKSRNCSVSDMFSIKKNDLVYQEALQDNAAVADGLIYIHPQLLTATQSTILIIESQLIYLFFFSLLFVILWVNKFSKCYHVLHLSFTHTHTDKPFCICSKCPTLQMEKSWFQARSQVSILYPKMCHERRWYL